MRKLIAHRLSFISPCEFNSMDGVYCTYLTAGTVVLGNSSDAGLNVRPTRLSWRGGKLKLTNDRQFSSSVHFVIFLHRLLGTSLVYNLETLN